MPRGVPACEWREGLESARVARVGWWRGWSEGVAEVVRHQEGPTSLLGSKAWSRATMAAFCPQWQLPTLVQR